MGVNIAFRALTRIGPQDMDEPVQPIGQLVAIKRIMNVAHIAVQHNQQFTEVGRAPLPVHIGLGKAHRAMPDDTAEHGRIMHANNGWRAGVARSGGAELQNRPIGQFNQQSSVFQLIEKKR